MGFKPVGVDENNLFPGRVETRLTSMGAADRARANHTGTQSTATIALFQEAVEDVIGNFVKQGTNVTLDWNDAANTLTINAAGSGGGLDAEAVQDAIGTYVKGTSPLFVTYDDAGTGNTTITTTATVNASDAALRARSSHTGTQLAATISDFTTAVNLATVDKMDVTDDVSLSQLYPGAMIIIDYYKASYGAANAWPGTRPLADTAVVCVWVGPTDPGAIMIAGDLFWKDA